MQRPRMNRPIQRKRLTCAECTRRKIKCDKVLPCSNCTRRGIVCYRHAEQRPRRPSTATVTSTSNSPDAEPGCRSDATELVNHLTARVRDLESTLRKIQSVQDTASSSSSTRSSHAPATSTDSNTHFERQLSPTEQNDLASPTQDLGNAEVENAATILEFLAWGRRKDPDYNEVITQKEDGSVPNQSPGDVGTGGGGLEEWPSDESWSLSGSKTSFIPFLRFLLPSRHQLVQIVDYHRHCLLWYHASFHSLALKAELEDFLDCYNGCVENPDVDLQWVAFLFSVMAGSMACAPRPVAQSWGFQKSEQRSLANRWFEATVVCLGLADYTACHSIYSVQAISTLTIAAHILGHSNRQSVLLASAVRVAQSLGLHRLGQEVDGPLSLNLVKREIGRRVWSQLCVQDWFSIPFSETYLIHGPSFNSRKPRNCHEEDMHPLPDDIPTDMAFNRFLYDVAALMPQLQDGLASCNTLYTKYEQVLRYDARMRELATSHIPCYLQNVPLDASWPCHVMWARKSVTISLSHKIIMIHRKFLGLSFTNPAFRFTRKTCVAASKTILKEQRKAANDNGPVLWIYDAFSVAACIILCFDMSHRNPSDKEYNEHLEIVQDVIEILSHSDISMIARRGVAILNALLDRENTKLDISEFIKSFCQQERSGPGQTRQGLGKNKQPGWPPGNADFIHSLQGPEAASNNPSMAPSTTDPSLADGRPESQTTSDPTSRSHYGCRQSGDELFFDFMPSQLGEFSTASHSWEDILFLAQNSAV